jgi:hypothetical protein
MPTPASVQIDPGDLLYRSGNSVYPASSQADAGSEILNQQLFAANFFGVANGQKRAADAGTGSIAVIIGADVEFDVVSASYVEGELLAADENGGGNGLLDQTLVKTTDPSAAIAVVTENRASTTKVFALPLTQYTRPSASQGGFQLIAQTILMNDASVTLTKVPGAPTGVLLYGNWLLVDPEGNTEILLLPPEADMLNEVLLIKNIGGETITLQNDAGGAVATIATSETCYAHCDGTTWTVHQHVFTT